MSRFECWHMRGNLGHQGHTAESTDERPKCNQDVSHQLGWLVPVAQHMGNGPRTIMPSWSRDDGVDEAIDIDMPTPGIAE